MIISSKYVTALKEFGLRHNEALVYISALHLGPTSVMAISADTKIRRTTVYEIIKSLSARGLMTTELKGFKKTYHASSPENLISIFENKKEKFLGTIPELMTFFKTDGAEDVIKTHESIESIKALYLDVLNSYRKGDFCYIVGNTEKFIEEDPKFFTKYIEDRAKMELDLKIITTDSEIARERKKFDRNFGAKIKILPPNLKFNASFTVTKNIVITHSTEGRLVAISTNNKNFISMQKNIFEVLWSSVSE